MLQEGVEGQLAEADEACSFADLLFEGPAVGGGEGEDVPDEEEVEQFLFYFGVHEYFVADVGDQSS